MKKDNIVKIIKRQAVKTPILDTIEKENHVDGVDIGLYDGYYVIGQLLDDVTAGHPIKVIRFERNGIKAIGYFNTSPIQEIRNNFCYTLNSIYEVEELNENYSYTF